MQFRPMPFRKRFALSWKLGLYKPEPSEEFFGSEMFWLVFSWACWAIWDGIIIDLYGLSLEEIGLCALGLVLGGPLPTHAIFWARHMKQQCGLRELGARLLIWEAFERGKLDLAKYFPEDEIAALATEMHGYDLRRKEKQRRRREKERKREADRLHSSWHRTRSTDTAAN